MTHSVSMSAKADQFFSKGHVHFAGDPALAAWIEAARGAALAAAAAPAPGMLRCGGTWFVGVDALPNDASGAVGAGPALAGEAVAFVREALGALPRRWHSAQVSVCYPGYPQPSAEESESAYLFRRNRDAAHVDGLHAEGPARRRHLREFHSFILGIPLGPVRADWSPVSVWEGSHLVMREVFVRIYGGLDPARWGEIDVTEAYQAARREVFASCPRIEITTEPGESYLIHRHALHGVAAWRAGDGNGPEAGRAVVYFRPEFDSHGDWLTAR